MQNPTMLRWIGQTVEAAELVLSVCTGALILAKAGLLDGMPVTTHHGALQELRMAAPAALVQSGRRVIDNGKFVVAAGVSSGIDASFHVVGRLLGAAAAHETAHYIEYPLTLPGA
jgi:transcriptional regulator GlxA family with amidase domain